MRCRFYITLFVALLPISGLCGVFSQAVGDEASKRYDTVSSLYSSVFKEIEALEASYSSDYFTFYHGQTGMRLPQDLVRILESYFNHQYSPTFYFLRVPDKLRYAIADIDDLFTNYLQGHSIDDSNKYMYDHLLSVNPSLYSNITNVTCSTLDFWLNNLRDLKDAKLRGIVEEILTYYGIDASHTEELIAMYSPISREDHILMQIFIPKNSSFIDTHIYPCHDRGLICHHVSDLSSREVLQCLEENPSSIPHFETLQFRLLLSHEFALNPKSGIIMFRHQIPLDVDREKAYMQSLEKWILKILPKNHGGIKR